MSSLHREPNLLAATRTARLGALVVSVCTCLAACGGGGGGDGGSASGGVFVDSPVQGLNFIAGLDVGVTNAQGAFTASPGTTVLFAVGDVVLGLAPFERQLTPISLVSGATNVTDPEVTNIARLLQSLDADSDPSNGITIDPAVRTAGEGLSLNFNQSGAAFEAESTLATLLAAAGTTLVSASDAQNHLRASLRGSYAGRFVGNYGGDDTGTFDVFIDRSGELVGCAFSNGDQDVFGVDGQVDLTGSGVFGNTTDMSSFSGTVGAGVIEGTWTNTFFGTAGGFGGTRVEVPSFVLDASALAPFVGSYTGMYVVPGETGAFSLIVGADGDLDITDGDPGEVRATILSIEAGVATFAGLADDGTLIRGTLLTDGTTSGTLNNPHDGEAGTFTGSM